MLNRWVQRFRGVRHLEWILALLAAALLLALLSAGWNGETDEQAMGMEARLERVLSAVEGAGRVRVLINEPEEVQAAFMNQTREKPAGVLVVAQGAGDIRVRMELSRAVQALLGVDAASVEILKMEENN